jgi:glycosyltransferase involved in cell wall biosynthesis
MATVPEIHAITEVPQSADTASRAPTARRHVAFFLPSFGGGGAQRMVINLATALEEAGCRVDLVVARKEGPYLKDIPAHIRVVNLGAERLRSALWPLIRYLRRERPEVVMATLTSASMLAVVACKLSRVGARIVLRQASAMGRRQRPWLVRRVYPHADEYIAISRSIADELTRIVGLTPQRVHTIRNPAFTPGILARARESVEHPWFSAKDTPVVIAVGQLVFTKGFDVLVDAFARLRAKRPCKLVILGEGKARASLQKQIDQLRIASDVWMPGFVDNPFKYVARSDVFVLSSKVEPFGNVIVEALAVGTPVVSTRCAGGPPEILENGQWGDLVPVGDSSAMAAAIERNLEGQRRYPADLKRYAQTFDYRSVAREYMAVLGVEQGVV